jgi:uncharacterized membrane protein
VAAAARTGDAEEDAMTRSTLTRIWIVGLLLIGLAGALALIGAALVASTGRPAGGPFAFAIAALAVGGLVQLVAWVMAMLATARIQRWGWFASLLVLGMFGLEFFVMLAYVLWGPDERAPAATLPA